MVKQDICQVNLCYFSFLRDSYLSIDAAGADNAGVSPHLPQHIPFLVWENSEKPTRSLPKFQRWSGKVVSAAFADPINDSLVAE